MLKTETRVPVGQGRLRNALETVRGECEALKKKELLRVNVEPLSAVTTVRGALSKILRYRDTIADSLPTFNLKYIDQLDTYALALMQAHTYFRATVGRPRDRTRLAGEAFVLREQILADVVVLKKRGFFREVDLTHLKGPNGHANIASDLMMLSTLVRNEWETVSKVSPITLMELDRAENLSDELIRAIGQSSRVPEALAFARQQRARTFTLFMRAYNQVRCAIAFIRSVENDAEEIAPSLYLKRRSRKEKREEAEMLGITQSSLNGSPATDCLKLNEDDPFLQ
jgi:hypothetical protein